MACQLLARIAQVKPLEILGLVYRNKGQIAEAIDYYRQALTIHRESGYLPSEAMMLSNIGVAYASLGQF